VLIVVFGFFFVVVSSRITGEIGVSANPVSGMTIAALIGTTAIFLLIGWTGVDHRVGAISIAAVIAARSSARASARGASSGRQYCKRTRPGPRGSCAGPRRGAAAHVAEVSIVVLAHVFEAGLDAVLAPEPGQALLEVPGSAEQRVALIGIEVPESAELEAGVERG
jgi:hypothetical protein